jgi:hypothetical protein
MLEKNITVTHIQIETAQWGCRYIERTHSVFSAAVCRGFHLGGTPYRQRE